MGIDEFNDELLTAQEVASLFNVARRTVNTWARQGKINSITTPGGRFKRFSRFEVELALQFQGGEMKHIEVYTSSNERLEIVLRAVLKGIENEERISASVDDMDRGLKFKVGNGPWSPPITGAIFDR